MGINGEQNHEGGLTDAEVIYKQKDLWNLMVRPMEKSDLKLTGLFEAENRETENEKFATCLIEITCLLCSILENVEFTENVVFF